MEIAVHERKLSLLEDEQDELEQYITNFFGVLDDEHEKIEQAFISIIDPLLCNINVNIDQNEQGETIQ